MQTILVIGAGAMGCLFAARMAESGADVMLIDVDRARLDAIAHAGIDLTDDSGTRTVRLAVGTAEEARGPFDLALLFTKGLYSDAAIRSVAHLAGAGTYALTLQNGLGNPEIVARNFPSDQVLKGMAALPADLHGATGVSSHGAGHVELGEMTPAGIDAAKAATALLARAGFDARYNDAIDIAIWEKVVFNAALNPLGAITGRTNGEIDNAPGRRIVAAMVDEAVATAHASGVMVDKARIVEAIDYALAHHRAHKASMLQDRIAGRASEIDSINGAICDAAQRMGVATPVMQTMADLMRVLEVAR